MSNRAFQTPFHIPCYLLHQVFKTTAIVRSMGSGKGKTNRAHALPVARWALDYDEAKWDKFVANTGGKDVNFYQYYLGKTSKTYTDAEHEQTIAELFHDAVAAGAIILPSPYKVNDFGLKMSSDPGFTRKVDVILKKRPKLYGQFWFPLYDRHFQRKPRLGDELVSNTIEGIAIGIEELFLKAKNDS